MDEVTEFWLDMRPKGFPSGKIRMLAKECGPERISSSKTEELASSYPFRQ